MGVAKRTGSYLAAEITEFSENRFLKSPTALAPVASVCAPSAPNHDLLGQSGGVRPGQVSNPIYDTRDCFAPLVMTEVFFKNISITTWTTKHAEYFDLNSYVSKWGFNLKR
jgi:hypothetical protein